MPPTTSDDDVRRRALSFESNESILSPMSRLQDKLSCRLAGGAVIGNLGGFIAVNQRALRTQKIASFLFYRAFVL